MTNKVADGGAMSLPNPVGRASGIAHFRRSRKTVPPQRRRTENEIFYTLASERTVVCACNNINMSLLHGGHCNARCVAVAVADAQLAAVCRSRCCHAQLKCICLYARHASASHVCASVRGHRTSGYKLCSRALASTFRKFNIKHEPANVNGCAAAVRRWRSATHPEYPK